MLSSFHHLLKSFIVEGNASANPGADASSNETPSVAPVEVGEYPGVHVGSAEEEEPKSCCSFTVSLWCVQL